MDAESLLSLSVQDYAVILATGAGIFLILIIGLSYLRKNALGGGGPYILLAGFLLAGIAVITSGKVEFGDFKAEFQQSYASNSATQNAQITALQTELERLRTALKDVAESVPGRSADARTIDASTALPPEFERNQEYQVLVFHKAAQTDNGRALADALLAAGFQSSATETELAEARQQFEHGTAWLVYSEKGEDVIDDVRNIILATTPETKIVLREGAYSLRSGDFQVLLF